MVDLVYMQCALERSRKSQDGPPELQVDLTDELEEAVAEIKRLQAENAKLLGMTQDARDAFHRMNSPTGREIKLRHELAEAKALLGCIAEHAAQMESQLYRDSEEWGVSQLVSECLAEAANQKGGA